jgi:NADH-quinone oxidoreductase subunit J
VFPFEIAAVILLVAIISAIALTLRGRKHTRYQDPATQLAAHPAQRLRLGKAARATGPAGETDAAGEGAR